MSGKHWGNRLAEFRTAIGLSQSAMAREYKTSSQTISGYEGAEKPKLDIKFAEYLSEKGANLHWILTGNGQMLTGNPSNPTNLHIVEEPKVEYGESRDTLQRIKNLEQAVAGLAAQSPYVMANRKDLNELRGDVDKLKEGGE